MSRGPYEIAEERVNKLRAELVDLDQRLKQVATRRAVVTDELAQIESAIRVFKKLEGGGTSRAAQVSPYGDLKTMTIPEGAAAIMRIKGGKASTSEILRALVDAGKTTKKQSSYNILVNALKRRTDLFRKVGRGEWEVLNLLVPNGHQNAEPALISLDSN
jgi:chorismate mutase